MHVYKTYEKIADWYDKNRSTDLFEKVWLDKATKFLTKGSEVLDLGCGTGTPIIPYFLKKGFLVTEIDGSTNLISIAKSRYPEVEFINSDMQTLDLHKKFDFILAWNSFFHLSQEDQRKMFPIFASHLKSNGFLMFTSGPDAGEIWSDNGGENLYHASLSPDEYKSLFNQYGFETIEFKISDPECGNSTVWLAKKQKYKAVGKSK